MPRRISLLHGPTPIERRPALDEIVGANVWIKRDDATGGAEAGNKIRKLEFLLAAAIDAGAEVVVTCGGEQSNHARATALACARLGLGSVLYLRVHDPKNKRLALEGNVLLDRLAGADICLLSNAEYRERNGIMEQARLELEREGVRAYVIPEGGSNGLGSLGYVEAMREVRGQLDLGLVGELRFFDLVAHACGSGGTAAGTALGAAAFGVAERTWAFAVCDDVDYFARVIGDIALETHGWDPSLPGPGALAESLVIDDAAKGPAYGVMSEDQKRFLVNVARKTGLILDPVYSGKALYGVAQAVQQGRIASNANVLFLHTGGLPGLLAQGESLREALDD